MVPNIKEYDIKPWDLDNPELVGRLERAMEDLEKGMRKLQKASREGNKMAEEEMKKRGIDPKDFKKRNRMPWENDEDEKEDDDE